MTTTKLTTAAILVAAGAALPLSLQWAGITHTANIDSGVRAVPEWTSPGQIPSAVQQTSAANQRPEPGIDLQLLERELRKLPFPDSDVKRMLDLERLMFQVREEEVPAVVALLKRLDPEHLGKVTSALFARWGEFAPEAAALAAEEMGDKVRVAALRGGLTFLGVFHPSWRRRGKKHVH